MTYEHEDLSAYEGTFRRHSASLSGPAHVKLMKLVGQLKADERFNHRASRSLVIEYLVWFHETRGELPMAQFRPYTRPQGRPRLLNGVQPPSEEAVRPSDVRAEFKRQGGVDPDVTARKL